MNTHVVATLLRLSAFSATLVLVPTVLRANETPARDRAAQLLATHGTVAVQAAGPYVERGTFRVQVSAKLGRPDLVLSDGTWLYHHRTVEGSEARGTLVVRFANGRVSQLALVTPAVVAALRAEPRGTHPFPHVATK